MKNLQKIAYEIRHLTILAGSRERVHFLGRSVRVLESSEEQFLLSIQNQGFNGISAGIQVSTEEQFDFIDILNNNAEALEISIAFSQSGIDDNRLTISGTINTQVQNWPDNQLITIDNHLPALDRTGYGKFGDIVYSSKHTVSSGEILSSSNNPNGLILRSLSFYGYNNVFCFKANNDEIIYHRDTLKNYYNQVLFPNMLITKNKGLSFSFSASGEYSGISVSYDLL